jgi:hypothetical protein
LAIYIEEIAVEMADLVQLIDSGRGVTWDAVIAVDAPSHQSFGFSPPRSVW